MTHHSATSMRLAGAATSHVGLVRAHNEDSGFVGPGLLLVADGVGGHASGEVASAIAARTVARVALEHPLADPVVTLGEALESCQRLVAAAALEPGRAGMSTTLTAVLGDGERFALLQLGDSRAYVLRDGDLVRLGRDHSVVQELVESGDLSPEDARTHPWRHVVTRVLAGDPDERGELLVLALRPGDRLLLCSDGLSDLVPETTLEALVRDHDDAGAVDALVAAALAAGGRDNITCLVATVVTGLPRSWSGELLGAAREAGPVALALPA